MLDFGKIQAGFGRSNRLFFRGEKKQNPRGSLCVDRDVGTQALLRA